jgi:hypothetical protein
MSRRTLTPLLQTRAILVRGILIRVILSVALCAWLLPVAAAAIPDQPAKPPASAAAHKPIHAHKRAAAKPSPAVPAPQIAAAPVAPPHPNWPVNNKPVDATVVWDSHGLRVDAANSSLVQILKDVSTDTGAKVEGLGTDTRIFGVYGPGPASEVISQLLNGTGYNVLMIGDQGGGVPRQIVLSSPPSGPAPQNSAGNTGDEDYQAEPQQQEPPSVINGFAPPLPRTPQQMQEMQLRQEQLQQQIRNQMMNQQQPQPEIDTPPQQLGK